MTLLEYIQANGMTVHGFALAAGISYSTIFLHTKKGRNLSIKTAKRIELFTKGQLSAAGLVGLTIGRAA